MRESKGKIDLQKSRYKKSSKISVGLRLAIQNLAKHTKMISSGEGSIQLNSDIILTKNGVFTSGNIAHASENPEGLSLNIPNYSPAFTNVKMNIDFENLDFKVHNLSANKGSGDIQVTGDLSLVKEKAQS